jgi:hypothetical protein
MYYRSAVIPRRMVDQNVKNQLDPPTKLVPRLSRPARRGQYRPSRVAYTVGGDGYELGLFKKIKKKIKKVAKGATKLVGTVTKQVVKAVPKLLPVAAGAGAAIFGGPAGMMMAGPLMAALSPEQKKKVQDVAQHGGTVPYGLPESYYQGAGVQPGQYISPMNASSPTPGMMDMGPQEQPQQAGGIDPMILMLGGGAALIAVMLMMQRK